MNPSGLTSTLSEALSAVTSSISSYFQKKGRFSQEFFIPAAAFVLGCLAVLMAILGPGVPRAWWESLTGDLKLLAIALLILALILVTELSRPLALLVRQLYSGEWPTWNWLQWRGRQSFLRDQLAWQKAPSVFATADATFNDLLEKLDEWETRKEKPVQTDYPVLIRSVGAYHFISEQDWCWAGAKQTDGAITTPAGLLGHYTLKPLMASEPVCSEDVHALPDKCYLANDRRIVTVEFFAGDLNDQIVRGMIVTLHVRRREGTLNVVSFPGLFVLDRSSNRLVLSVPSNMNNADTVESLTWILPGSRLTLSYDVSADLRPLQAVPTVRAKDGTGQEPVIKRGQLILREQIEWAVKTATEVAALGDIFTVEADIVDKIYWPTNLDPDPPSRGKPFRKQDLVSVPAGAKPEWFVFSPDGVIHSRLAYRLDLSDATPETQTMLPNAELPTPVTIGTRTSGGVPVKGLKIEYSAKDARSTSPDRNSTKPTDSYPLAKGDRAEVSFYEPNANEPFDNESLCYIYDLQKNDHCYLLVRDPVRFAANVERARKNGKIILNPFVGLPVLVQQRHRGQLIESSQVATRLFQAKDGVLVDEMCLSKAGLDDCYVVANSLEVQRPIPKTAIKKVLDGEREWLSLDFAGEVGSYTVKDRGDQPLDNPWSVIKRGDLVNVKVCGSQSEVIPWDLAFVRKVDPEARCMEIAVPSWKKDLAYCLWNTKNSKIELTLTHSDCYVQADYRQLCGQIEPKDQLAPMSRILSASTPQERTVNQEANELRDIVESLTEFREKLDERSWYVSSLVGSDFKTGEEAFWSLQERLRAVVKRWKETEQALENRREREAVQALPDEAAEVRPTRLGNVLAAAADYPERVYAIDTPTILPRLLNVLKPEDGAVTDSVILRLISAEASLNMMLLFSFWGAVWAVLGAVALLAFAGPWWMFPVVVVGGILLSWLTKGAAESQAVAYGEALKAVFDLRRHKLLEAIGYQLTYPISPEEEQPHWRNLNSLFALGVAKDFPPMNKPADQSKGV